MKHISPDVLDELWNPLVVTEQKVLKALMDIVAGELFLYFQTLFSIWIFLAVQILINMLVFFGFRTQPKAVLPHHSLFACLHDVFDVFGFGLIGI